MDEQTVTTTAIREAWQVALVNAIADAKLRDIDTSLIIDSMLTVAFANKASMHGGEAAINFFYDCAQAYTKLWEKLQPAPPTMAH